MRLTIACVLTQSGRLVLRDVLTRDKVQLVREGYRPYPILLETNEGQRQEADLWSTSPPSMMAMLDAARLLFGEKPGAVSWDSRGYDPFADERDDT
jgi:hypothetical protein